MLRVLMVDDDAMARKGIQTLMPWEKHGMTVVGQAENGKIALDFLEHNEVDLVLVDVDMPVMDGITFIKVARKKHPGLSFVVLTVHTEFEYIQEALRIGAIDYIAKSNIDKEDFDETLERIRNSVPRRKVDSRYSTQKSLLQSHILYP